MKLAQFFLLTCLSLCLMCTDVWAQRKRETRQKAPPRKIKFTPPLIDSHVAGMSLNDTYWRIQPNANSSHLIFTRTQAADTLADVTVHFINYTQFVLHYRTASCRKQLKGNYWLDLRPRGEQFASITSQQAFTFSDSYAVNGCSYAFAVQLSHVLNHGYVYGDTFSLLIDLPKGLIQLR